MDKEAHTKFTKARAGLVLDQPFFASIALRLKVQEDPTSPTMYTDGVNLGYNPEWINSLTLDELKGVICHEVMHVALLHNLRRDNREHDQWNIAADYAINPILLDANMTLPKGDPGSPADPQTIRQYEGMSAEEIYNKLPKLQKGKDKEKGKGGSGAFGQQGEEETQQQGNDPGKCGEVRDFPSPSGQPTPTPAELAQQEQEQKIQTQQALTAAKRAGTLPGSLERLIDDLLEPIIPWKEVLARFVDTHAKNDYDWTRSNKRYAAQGLYLPALRNPELGNILLAVDTSGSITQKQVTEFIGEIRGILRSYDKTNLTVIFCDHAIQGEPQTIEQEADTEILKPKGGGGTSFKPPFEYAEEQGLTPKAAIYFTDGYSSSFSDPPDYDTLWVLTEKNDSFNSPFGEVIYMEKEE
jgi:predicted metal-dependent peptidase